MRRSGVKVVAAIAVVAAATAFLLLSRSRPPVAAGANVLLITLDTLRADRLGAYGNTSGLTPNLDALAAGGVVFAEALASAPLTLPSHSTILSGLDPPHHGVHENGGAPFPAQPATLATLLHAQGYATGAFVGAYVLDRRFGLARGFDVYDDRIERREEGASTLESERPCETVVAAARNWMARQPGSFLAWVHLYDAHAPYAAPPAFRDAHVGQPYDAEVAHLDACIAPLLADTAQHTLRVVLADHGESLGEHGELTHGFFIYQATLRIPLLLAGPGIPRGERREGPARTADVLPTILGRLGIAAPAGLDGIDALVAPSSGEAYAESRYPRTFGWAPLRAFRSGRFKLIDAPRAELFDLTADPGETRNLIEQEADTARRLRTALASFSRNERVAEAASVAPEVAERLKALGYIASAPAPVADEAGLLDPKDALPTWRAFEEATWAAARGDHEAAIAALRPLLSREPKNPVFLRGLAASLRQIGKQREAAELLAHLPDTEASDAAAWHERAIALAGAGRAEDAITSERKAIALQPLPESFNHLGGLEAGRGHLKEALQAFESASALDPNNARAWNNQGNALHALGRDEEAVAAYRKAAGLAPNDPDPRNGLGVLMVQAGRLAEAVEVFRAVLEIAPGHGEARLNLAVALAQQGKTGEARAVIERLLHGAADGQLRSRAERLLQDLDR